MKKILKKEFFNRKSDKVAESLIGKFLIRKIKGKEKAYKIIEAEAYLGEDDGASHARFGKTAGNETMYGSPGIFYIYLIYGMYWMLNIVTDKKNTSSAVLIRGIEGLDGPGKLTKALRIDKSLYGKEATKKSNLWFEDRGEKPKLKKLPRVGVDYAEEKWRKARLRFILDI